jgi:small-conductance mechanosensitive channel
MAEDTSQAGQSEQGGSVMGLEDLDLQVFIDQFAVIQAFVVEELFSVGSILELAVIGLAFLLAMVTDGWCGRLVSAFRDQFLKGISEDKLKAAIMPVLFAFLGLIWASIGRYALEVWDQPTALTTIAINLMGAWVVIRLFSNVIGEPFWARAIASMAWTLAALNIFGLLEPVIGFLDSLAFNAGEKAISVLLVFKAIGLVVLLLWGSSILSSFLQRRINGLPALTPSIQLLVGKVTRITLIALAFFVALTSLGIDLSIFAVLGGAIGIGVGFGLQKIVGNFISGLILLMDRSIKPGDVIEVAGTYGWVRSLGARYTSVVTRDGHEHLIPNEDFIVNTVTNWSFSDRNVRVRKPVGVAYNTDIRKAQALVIEAAIEVDRVLKDPPPQCHLTGFGDNSIDLEVRFWLGDPENGTANVSSQVLLGIWDRFREEGIEIPYPQRDIHIKEMPVG